LWQVRLGVSALFSLLVISWVARPWVAGDTPFVWDGTNAFLDCMSRGDLVACRHSGELNYWGLTSPIGDWPLLQHIPDLIAIGFGADGHHSRELVFVSLSAAAIVASVVLARLVLRRTGEGAWFWGYLFIVLSGPMIVYARTTAGEALATGLLVCVVAAAVLPASPPVLAIAVLAASLTKETSYPFVAALVVLGLLLARSRTEMTIRRHLTWGTGGLLAAIALASFFNIVRFGSVLNTNYLEPELRTPGLIRPLEYALALVLSPNGGIVVYWPAASALLTAACLLPLAFRSGARLDMRPALVLIGIMAALTLGFASWWDIFGNGYGPRLTLPWVLPLVLTALVAYGTALGDVAFRVLTRAWGLVLVWSVVLLSALPHVGQLWKPELVARFASDSPPCVAPWRGGINEFHSCQHDRLWFNHRPKPTYAVEGTATLGGAVTAVMLALALLGCLVLLREDLRVRRTLAVHGRPDVETRAAKVSTGRAGSEP
jgi:hypothetical protein